MMHTYFIGSDTVVKIGRSENPASRLQQLQTASPERLTLLLVIDGDHESELHEMFANDRLQGEWFTLGPAIRAYISHLKPLEQGDGIPLNEEGEIICPFCTDSLSDQQQPSGPLTKHGESLRLPMTGECGHQWMIVFSTHAGRTYVHSQAAL